MFGEMAGVMLSSQRVVPAATRKSGYQFRYPDLDDAPASLNLSKVLQYKVSRGSPQRRFHHGDG